jgi:hypothetical protein
MAMLRVKSLARILFLALGPIFASASVGPTDKEPSRFLTIWAGMLPLILAAPHGGRLAIPVAPRRGIGVAQFTIERDSNTAELAELLAVKLGVRLGAKPFLVIAHFERKFIDANRSENSAFESPAPNHIMKPITARYRKLRRGFGKGGAAGCCSTFMAKGRKRIRFFAAPTTAKALQCCANGLAPQP